jgi:CRP-like cAMP-binding protein
MTDLDELPSAQHAISIAVGFNGLTASEAHRVLREVAQRRTAEAGEVIVREGDPADRIYIIETGEVEILKSEPEAGGEHRIARLRTGDVIGDVALIDTLPRSATARALTRAYLIELPIDDLRRVFPPSTAIGDRILTSVSEGLARKLRQTSQVTVDSMRRQLDDARARLAMGQFIVKVMGVSIAYMYLLGALTSLSKRLPSTTLIAAPMLFAIAVVVGSGIAASPYPISAYGFNLKNWRRALRESLAYTVLLMVAMIAAKWLLLRLLGAHDLPLFELGRSSLSREALLVATLTYTVFVPIQEIVARSGVQSSLQLFLNGPRAPLIANLLATLLFCALHLHLSIAASVAVLPVALFWGWLYARQDSLLGVCVSHVLVGNFFFLVLGWSALLSRM